MKRAILLSLATVLLLSLAPGTGRAAETHRVFMTAPFVFCNTPAGCTANEDTRIKVGDTVEWVFDDPLCVAFHALGCAHTATRLSGSGQWDSGRMPGSSPTFGAPSPKLTFSRTFTSAGSFAYICSIHTQQNMKATIIVSA